MDKRSALISCLLLSVGAATAQTGPTRVSERLLPQWLTGIIAVSGFLFLCFVCFLVKKAWCEEPSRSSRSSRSSSAEAERADGNTYDTALDLVRSKEDVNAYDNLVIDSDDDKVTSM